jgi:hypothetical protein
MGEIHETMWMGKFHMETSSPKTDDRHGVWSTVTSEKHRSFTLTPRTFPTRAPGSRESNKEALVLWGPEMLVCYCPPLPHLCRCHLCAALSALLRSLFAVWVCFLFLFNETGSHSVAQADLKPLILLPQTPECWDYRCEPPHLVEVLVWICYL